jgi:hypothetical protein
MTIRGGFGTTFDLETGTHRRWVAGADGIRRWSDTGEPADLTADLSRVTAERVLAVIRERQTAVSLDGLVAYIGLPDDAPTRKALDQVCRALVYKQRLSYFKAPSGKDKEAGFIPFYFEPIEQKAEPVDPPRAPDQEPRTIKTTAGEDFTTGQTAMLARLVWLRFGRDRDAATAAWNRLLGNQCSTAEFMALFKRGWQI